MTLFTEQEREDVASILETVAADGLPEPRDLDVALDAIEAALSGPNRELRRVLLMAAASNQGGNSAAGAEIAALFGIPFPVTMEGLEEAAHREGFDPAKLWPWLQSQRLRQAFTTEGGE